MACVRLKQDAVCHRLGGCISTSGDDDRRRRRSDLGGDDPAETSAAVRRHSRVLSRWIARETITSTLDDRRRRESELVALAELHTASILQRWRELEEESRAEVSNGRLSRENSPETSGDVERERVRQIVGMMDSLQRRGSMRDESSRGEWLGERERERVRVVRERVWMASQGEGRRGERERESGGGTGEVPRLRGRQARDDVIMRMARERQRELQGLSEHRVVSGFAFRNRIHLLLRGRFLRNASSIDDERPPSLVESELGLIRRRYSVSGLREGFSLRRESNFTNHASSGPPSSHTNTEPVNISRSTQDSTMEMPRNDLSQFETTTRNLVVNQPIHTNETTETERNIPNSSTEQSMTAQEESREEEHTSPERRDEGETHISWEVVENGETDVAENIEEWSPNGFDDTAERWHDLVSHHITGPQLVSGQRTNSFSYTDDDSTYGIEIRDLLSRRSVSTLLSSNFRQNLDQLIQSYVQRQENTPLDWDLEEAVSPALLSPEQDQVQERNNTPNELYIDQNVGSTVNLPPPPAPPVPHWQSGLHNGGWTRRTIHQPEIDWDIVNVLREEMARLQEGMGNLQRMLETCMEMQLEVQRSVRQEVSAALNRSLGFTGMEGETTAYGSKWSHVRKGTCCVCCDNHIDSVLYRCGHMCTCTRCANELARGGDKCPLCRAPIVEVIRAYSIL